MDHLLVRSGSRRVLLVDVHGSPDGKGIGFGMMLIRIGKALLAGRMMQGQVFFVPSRKPLNSAVTRLESDDVTIIPPDSWQGRCLTWLWRVAVPFRIGAPWLWAQRTVARAVVGPVYTAVERSTWLPRRVRRFLMRQGPLLRALKKANTRYAARSEARWNRLYKQEVIPRLRTLEESGDETVPFRLRLPAPREGTAVAQAAALGIRLDAPLVTVHVRESGYRADAGLRQRGWEDVRNAHIESFLPAFEALVARGYTVVRLGDPTMTPVRMPGVVDLATSPDRNEWLDIWCTMRSEFLIGCDSGPSWLAMLLGVPILTVNAVHFRDLSRSTDRIICKLARDRATGTVLSVAQMLTEDFLREGFKGGRFDYLDNSPADIRRATLDMIEVVHGREQRSSWQHQFRRRLREVERQSLGGRSALEGVAVMGRARGTIARGFAKAHFLRTAMPEPPDVGQSDAR